MSIAKVIEISARSDESFEAAAQHGVAEASKTVKNIREAWVNQMKVQITDGRITGYQVDMKMTFVVD